MRQDHDLINGLDDDMNDVIDIGDDGRIATTDELDVGDNYNFGSHVIYPLMFHVAKNKS